MAGGSGERFWPLSKKGCPKQFLSLLGGSSLLRQTADRLQGLVRQEDIYIVTLREYKAMVMEHIPWIDENNILAEPFGRDTAAAAGIAAVEISRQSPDAIMIMLPADHYIANQKEFRNALKAAADAASTGESVVTVGIPPSRPETGYGYIQMGAFDRELAGLSVHRAVKFTEKPLFDKALEFVESGNYLWNSGIFIWRVDLIRRLIDLHLPVLSEGLKKIESSSLKEKEHEIEKVYQRLPKISVDYGILEKINNILVIRSNFGWDDVGSWTALKRIDPAVSGEGNVIRAKGTFLNTKNSIIISPHRIVAAMGISDIILVDDGRNLLICGKEQSQEIKRLIQSLHEAGFLDSL